MNFLGGMKISWSHAASVLGRDHLVLVGRCPRAKKTRSHFFSARGTGRKIFLLARRCDGLGG